MFGFIRKKDIKREIIVNAESLETRVAVVESGIVEEFQMEHPTEERIVGSIYKGRIQNLEHDLQAAFVDIGFRKNAFLHYWDMMPDDQTVLQMEEGVRRRNTSRRKRYTNGQIEKRFPAGSEIVVQVTKGPIGSKGPRVTAALSIPGRYLVLVPGANIKGVSRKIGDASERQRLKKILDRLPLPDSTGLIVRTAAAGARKRSFARDLKGIVASWEELQRGIREEKAPCCVYQEPDLVERVVRDWLTEDVDRVIVDSPQKFERIRKMASNISRRAKSVVQPYKGDKPVFDHYGIEAQLEAAFRRQVPLLSGGYLVFDETEALIAIDVNTARHKGKGDSQEQTILEVNTEAVLEVARQLRLRNIGGLVVIDLIDMRSRKHQNSVYRALKAALKRDRARTHVLPISELGLLEMTRQRVEESLLSAMYVECPYCHGRGRVKSALGMSVDIQRQLAAIMRRRDKKGKTFDLQIVVHPTVLERLQEEDEDVLMDLQKQFHGELHFKSSPAQHMARFIIQDRETAEILFSSAEK